MKRVCMYLIDLYRKYLSPLKRKSVCRFYPSCSNYAYEAFKKHGFFAGFYLSMKRILKCNPFFRGGIDYVPEKIDFLSVKRNRNFKNGD